LTQNDFRDVRMDLNARQYRALARRLPWPYNGMVNDVIGCIQTKGNYLAALGLVCYSEFCGREFLFAGDQKKTIQVCFEGFLEYVGCGALVEKWMGLKERPFSDAVRNGLVHRYFLKVPGGIYMVSEHPDANRFGFIVDKEGHVNMVVIPYFKLFVKGLERAKSEGKLKSP